MGNQPDLLAGMSVGQGNIKGKPDVFPFTAPGIALGKKGITILGRQPQMIPGAMGLHLGQMLNRLKNQPRIGVYRQIVLFQKFFGILFVIHKHSFLLPAGGKCPAARLISDFYLLKYTGSPVLAEV